MYGEFESSRGGCGTLGGGDIPAYRVEMTSAIGAGAGARLRVETLDRVMDGVLAIEGATFELTYVDDRIEPASCPADPGFLWFRKAESFDLTGCGVEVLGYRSISGSSKVLGLR